MVLFIGKVPLGPSTLKGVHVALIQKITIIGPSEVHAQLWALQAEPSGHYKQRFYSLLCSVTFFP